MSILVQIHLLYLAACLMRNPHPSQVDGLEPDELSIREFG